MLGVYRFAAVYSGDAGAVTQVANDDLHLIIRFSNDLSGSLRYVAVGSTMEAVTSNFCYCS